MVVAASVPQSMLAWLLLAMGIGQAIGNAQAGRAVDRYGPRRTLTVGLVGALQKAQSPSKTPSPAPA
ncbi:hypothetical protein LTT66_09495 [Nocardia gipuzkoensis]|uniref:hypothetical protein n=1 Tax=Nocardia gipuzkoensis TaxID=2749991 RepID=UPI001E41613B|nr:hypothetical protein [Nocardia gipuzkoensis]UGT70368.1 hypothetical protein LTT66_09495 [Nocardia gipuzkoensis]